jgi:hypothetical protein
LKTLTAQEEYKLMQDNKEIFAYIDAKYENLIDKEIKAYENKVDNE